MWWLDGPWYLRKNTDVSVHKNVTAREHYARYGIAEGRDPNPLLDAAWYKQVHGLDPDVDAGRHYAFVGWRQGTEPCHGFAEALQALVADLGMEPCPEGVPPLKHALMSPGDVLADLSRRLEPIRPAMLRHIKQEPDASGLRLCVIFHLGGPGEWDYYRRYLKHLARIPHDLYVTIHPEHWSPDLPSVFVDLRAPGTGSTHIIVTENRGMDLGGWFMAMDRIDKLGAGSSYDCMLKIHTKTTRQGSTEWRRVLLDSILGSPERVRACMRALKQDRGLGMIGCANWIVQERTRADVFALAARMGLPKPGPRCAFIGGTMFWARFDFLAAAFRGKDLGAMVTLFPPGAPPGESEAHAMERLLGCLVTAAGLTIRGSSPIPDATMDVAPGFSAPPWDVARKLARREARSLHWAALFDPACPFRHAEVLLRLARRCDRITECGAAADGCHWALALGLLRKPPKDVGDQRSLTAVDSKWRPEFEQAFRMCKAGGVRYEFRLSDDALVELDEADMLVLHRWSVYGHVKRQLEAHHSKARKWIAVLNTTIYADVGELVVAGCDVAAQCADSGYGAAEIRGGVWPAVQEFLGAHADRWRLHGRWMGYAGLAVLERTAPEEWSTVFP